MKLQGLDLNQRPLDYESNVLTSCTTLRDKGTGFSLNYQGECSHASGEFMSVFKFNLSPNASSPVFVPSSSCHFLYAANFTGVDKSQSEMSLNISLVSLKPAIFANLSPSVILNQFVM
jgi:hypothetical protein